MQFHFKGGGAEEREEGEGPSERASIMTHGHEQQGGGWLWELGGSREEQRGKKVGTTVIEQQF